MKLHPRLSRAAVELVSRFETFHASAQPAAGGGWTVGYGHTRSAREGATVTRADAEALLLYDLVAAAETVEAALFAPASQRQFEALTAFCFNIGADNFRASSALARFNAGAELQAADEIERWRNAELGAGAQVVDALVRRRAAEKAHFLGLPEGCSKTPRAVLRPVLMGDAAVFDAPPPAPSATLSAAEGIQARLRQLVPEPEPTSAPEAGHWQAEAEAPPFPQVEVADSETSAAPPIPAGDPAVEPDADRVLAPAGPAPPTPYVVPPPPAPAQTLPDGSPANDVLPPPSSASTLEAAVAPPQAPLPLGKAQLRFKPSGRLLYQALAAVGACLFVAAAVLILAGRPDLPSLLLGVVGAVMLAAAIYGLLGQGRADSQGRRSATA